MGDNNDTEYDNEAKKIIFFRDVRIDLVVLIINISLSHQSMIIITRCFLNLNNNIDLKVLFFILERRLM